MKQLALFFNRLNFLEQFKISSKNWAERLSIFPCVQLFPPPSPTIKKPALTCHYHPKSIDYNKAHTWYFITYGPMGFDKCCIVITFKLCINFCSIKQKNFTTLNIACVPPIHHSLPAPKPVITTNLFTLFIVLPFPEFHISGII